jgi:hypothetical protein
MPNMSYTMKNSGKLFVMTKFLFLAQNAKYKKEEKANQRKR